MTRDGHRQRLIHFAEQMVRLMRQDAPEAIVKAQWQRVVAHGRKLFGRPDMPPDLKVRK